MKIDHIGIAVKDLEEKTNLYQKVLGLELEEIEEVPQQKVKVAKLKLENSMIELLCPIDPTSPISAFLDKKGEGIHHIALEVENIEEKLAQLEADGVPLIDKKPRLGASGKKIAFLHPKALGGVLVELVSQA